MRPLASDPMTTRTDVDRRVVLDELETQRRALTGYCYRMLGSAFEADDAVQETMIRAWKGIEGFEGRSALRSWLYRIATNVCLDMLRGRQRRARPMDLGPRTPSSRSGVSPSRRTPGSSPSPDALVVSPDDDPAEQAATRDSVRLAFVTALQHLPARQRAVLVLREVLRWPRLTSPSSWTRAWRRSTAPFSGPGPPWRRWMSRAAKPGRRRTAGAPGPLRGRVRALRHRGARRAPPRRRHHVDAPVRLLASRIGEHGPLVFGPRRRARALAWFRSRRAGHGLRRLPGRPGGRPRRSRSR